MRVRAKFRVDSITAGEATQPDGTKTKVSEELRFSAVYSPDPNSENYSWSKWTPAGQLSMTVTNPDAFDHFKVGEEVYLTLSPIREAVGA